MSSRSPKNTYHHGDLRAELLKGARAIVEEGGIAHLSLRRVARRAAVSHGAPYHHFPDKTALLSALSEEGFVDLDAALERVCEREFDRPEQKLAVLGRTYVRYALDHPHAFRFMFRPELVSPDTVHGSTPAAGRALERIVSAARDYLLELGRDDEDPYVLAMVVWSAVHGVASLWIDGPLAGSGYDADVVAGLAIDSVVKGIREGVGHRGPYQRTPSIR